MIALSGDALADTHGGESDGAEPASRRLSDDERLYFAKAMERAMAADREQAAAVAALRSFGQHLGEKYAFNPARTDINMETGAITEAKE
jgi:hypothetical protein